MAGFGPASVRTTQRSASHGTRGSIVSGFGPAAGRRHGMKNFYWCIAAALLLTVFAVLFVPGVDEFVERTFQRYVGRAAR